MYWVNRSFLFIVLALLALRAAYMHVVLAVWREVLERLQSALVKYPLPMFETNEIMTKSITILIRMRVHVYQYVHVYVSITYVSVCVELHRDLFTPWNTSFVLLWCSTPHSCSHIVPLFTLNGTSRPNLGVEVPLKSACNTFPACNLGPEPDKGGPKGPLWLLVYIIKTGQVRRWSKFVTGYQSFVKFGT